MKTIDYHITCRPMNGLSGEQVDNQSLYDTPGYLVSIQSLPVNHHCSEQLYCTHTSPWNGLKNYLPYHHSNAVAITLL